MSVYHYLSAAPPTAEAPDPERFAALLDELIDGGVVSLPTYVLVGQAGRRPSAFWLGNLVGSGRRPVDQVPDVLADKDLRLAVTYAGSERTEIRSAVLSAPFGSADIGVYFPVTSPPGVDPGGPRIRRGSREPLSIGCDGAIFATRRPVRLGRNEAFVVSSEYELFGYDPDDPDDQFVDGTWRPAMAFPIDKEAGYSYSDARWFASVEGGYAWYLAGSVLKICARHFGPDLFAGYFAI